MSVELVRSHWESMNVTREPTRAAKLLSRNQQQSKKEIQREDEAGMRDKEGARGGER